MYQGIHVDLLFKGEQPTFGDLFLITGEMHPLFPPTGDFKFAKLADLNFDQCDDFWCIRDEDTGHEFVWLYPLVGRQVVYHNVGPFSGLRLDYCILRNPIGNIDRFLLIVSSFAQELPVLVTYPLRNIILGNPPDVSILKTDMDLVVNYWRSKGIEPGSYNALSIRY